MESFHRIMPRSFMPLTFIKKRFFQPVNGQKPRTEWGTCTSFLHIPHSYMYPIPTKPQIRL